MKQIAIAVVLTAIGCGVESGSDDGADQTADIPLGEPPPPGVNPYCYYQGGVYWCQDAFTGKWCSTHTVAYGWDYTRCAWSGYDSRSYYCTNGWQWSASHDHCQ